MCRSMARPSAGAHQYHASAGAPRAGATPVRKRSGQSVDGYRASPIESRRGFQDGGAALPAAGLRIDWDISPNQLLAGDLSALDPQDAALIKHAASRPEIVALAKQFNLDPTVLVVALVARSQSATNRSAARLAKAILGDRIPEDMLLMITARLGLDRGGQELAGQS
jgi:hypothetical protein